MKVISCLLALIATSVSGLTAEVAAEDPFAAALQERMALLLASNKVPGAVVSYIKNGAVTWTKAFGLADLKTGSPMRPDMVFNHGPWSFEAGDNFHDDPASTECAAVNRAWLWNSFEQRRAVPASCRS